MKRFRDPEWALILLFVGILFVVPVVQVLREIGGEGGVRAFEVFGEAPTAANLRAFEKNLEQASWAAELSRPWLQYAHFHWLKDGGEKVVVGNSDWLFYKPGLNYMLANLDRFAPSATNDPVAAIVDFRDQLAAHGIRLLVMPVPNKESVYPDRLSSSAAHLQQAIAPRTREILEKLKTAKVEVIDLFKEYAEERNQAASSGAPPLYLAQDTHWSPHGVVLAAKKVAQRLMELGWIGAGSKDYQIHPAPVERIGDLVRMLQAPMIERSIVPEKVASLQVIQGDPGKPYVDEAEAEVLVLGDSFMRIYQQDAPTSAGFIAHLAKELRQPLMSLVNDGGGSTLVREELAARPIFLQGKKVVVWEFVERDFGLGVKGWQKTRLPTFVGGQDKLHE